MSTYRVFVPRSADDFEDICFDYIQSRYPNLSSDKFGRRGQKQFGIDIYADDFNILVQCKNYYVSSTTNPTKKANELIRKIQEDYSNASKHFPNFQSYIIMTTFERDTKIQKSVPNIGKNISVLFWDTIEDFLLSHKDILYRHYPEIYTDIIPQKTASFISETEAFIWNEERSETEKLREHYQIAKESGLYISQLSDKKEFVMQILSLLDELFSDIVQGRKKKNIERLEKQIKYISENGPQRLVQYFDDESKEYVEVSELDEDCDEYYRVSNLREMINAEKREFNSRISKAKKLLESLKAAL